MLKRNTMQKHINQIIKKKQDVDYIDRIEKYIEKIIIVNFDKQQKDIYNLDVYDKNSKIGTTKLKYDFKYRRLVEE